MESFADYKRQFEATHLHLGMPERGRVLLSQVWLLGFSSALAFAHDLEDLMRRNPVEAAIQYGNCQAGVMAMAALQREYAENLEKSK